MQEQRAVIVNGEERRSLPIGANRQRKYDDSVNARQLSVKPKRDAGRVGEEVKMEGMREGLEIIEVAVRLVKGVPGGVERLRKVAEWARRKWEGGAPKEEAGVPERLRELDPVQMQFLFAAVLSGNRHQKVPQSTVQARWFEKLQEQGIVEKGFGWFRPPISSGLYREHDDGEYAVEIVREAYDWAEKCVRQAEQRSRAS